MKPCNSTEVQDLTKLVIVFPTPKKVQKIIGLQIHKNHGIIKHIALLKAYQNQGIGKVLITQAIKDLSFKTCEIETDAEGKDFYEKCGFNCNPFEGKYNLRYQCGENVNLYSGIDA